jgi:hypothetical protein
MEDISSSKVSLVMHEVENEVVSNIGQNDDNERILS